MPKTNLGKWSVGLILVMFVLLFIGSSLTDSLYESVPAGSTILADIIGRPAFMCLHWLELLLLCFSLLNSCFPTKSL